MFQIRVSCRGSHQYCRGYIEPLLVAVTTYSRPAQKARKTKKDDDEDNLGQRVILVTEPHTDINAGLVIILGSDHESPIDLANAAEVAAQLPPEDQDEFWDGLAAEILGHYRDTTLGYLRNYNDPIYSTVEESRQGPAEWTRPNTNGLGSHQAYSRLGHCMGSHWRMGFARTLSAPPPWQLA